MELVYFEATLNLAHPRSVYEVLSTAQIILHSTEKHTQFCHHQQGEHFVQQYTRIVTVSVRDQWGIFDEYYLDFSREDADAWTRIHRTLCHSYKKAIDLVRQDTAHADLSRDAIVGEIIFLVTDDRGRFQDTLHHRFLRNFTYFAKEDIEQEFVQE